LWLVLGAVVALGIFAALLRYQKPWLARTVWGVHALRLPALIGGAFFASDPRPSPPSFYLTAIVVVMINLWMLARAGWDL
jgi:hypothetical protein